MIETVSDPGDSEQVFPSTRWVWKRVKVPGNAGTAKAQPAERSSRMVMESRVRLARRAMRHPLPASLAFRGGPECWVSIETRGRTFRFPGYTDIYTVLRVINQVPADVEL